MHFKNKKFVVGIIGISAWVAVYSMAGVFFVVKVGIPAAISLYLGERLWLTRKSETRRGLSMLIVALSVSVGGTAIGFSNMLETVRWNAEQSAEVQDKLRGDARFRRVTIEYLGAINERSLTIGGTVKSLSDATALREETSNLHFKTNVRWRVKIQNATRLPEHEPPMLRQPQASELAG